MQTNLLSMNKGTFEQRGRISSDRMNSTSPPAAMYPPPAYSDSGPPPQYQENTSKHYGDNSTVIRTPYLGPYPAPAQPVFPGYGLPPQQPVCTQPAPISNFIVVQPQPRKSALHKYLPFAIFVTVCCNCPLGILGIVFALLADQSMENPRTFNVLSLVFSVIALLCGLATWIYIIVHFAIFFSYIATVRN